jgi:hypothetical protein
LHMLLLVGPACGQLVVDLISHLGVRVVRREAARGQEGFQQFKDMQKLENT